MDTSTLERDEGVGVEEDQAPNQFRLLRLGRGEELSGSEEWVSRGGGGGGGDFMRSFLEVVEALGLDDGGRFLTYDDY
jgi:hypothetical protein